MKHATSAIAQYTRIPADAIDRNRSQNVLIQLVGILGRQAATELLRTTALPSSHLNMEP
jgi:hypothetical protein